MASCTFFGHRDYNSGNRNLEIKPLLRELIQNCNVDTFYVGSQGNFDIAVLLCLREMQAVFPHIAVFVVLAYHPAVRKYSDIIKSEETIFPEKMENIHPKFAVAKRNEWMISKSDYAVVYVKNSIGGAAKYKALAEKKKLKVINIFNRL